MANKKHAETPVVQARVSDILRLRLAGCRRWDILQYVADQEKVSGGPWSLKAGETPMGTRNVEVYISRADKALRETSEKKRKDARARHLAQRRFLYARAVAANENANALAVLKDEADLMGLYPPKKTASTDSKGRDKAPEAGPLDIIAAIIAANEVARGRADAGVDAAPDA